MGPKTITKPLGTKVLDKIELQIENNNTSLGKTVLQVWSQICDKMAKLVHKMTVKKSKS